LRADPATEDLVPPFLWQAFLPSEKERPMIRRMMIPALAAAALLAGSAWAQTAKDDNGSQTVMQKIHDELTAQGFKDVKVVPSAFIVSGKNKDGTPVMMLIGPNSMTMLAPADPDALTQGLQTDKEQPDWQ
jgi:hypothetical protein